VEEKRWALGADFLRSGKRCHKIVYLTQREEVCPLLRRWKKEPWKKAYRRGAVFLENNRGVGMEGSLGKETGEESPVL